MMLKGIIKGFSLQAAAASFRQVVLIGGGGMSMGSQSLC